jgi:hypothetical protein
VIYVRHQGPVATSGRVFPTNRTPYPCAACGDFSSDEPIVLVPIGFDDDESRKKAEAGRWTNAVAIVVHARCAGVAVAQEETHDA